ncbi:hypothetical protein D3C76_389130 [compost metagenome]
MSVEEFDKKGFLSDYVYQHRDEVRDKYSEIFSECEKISEQAQALILSTSVSDSDVPLVCSFLFMERTVRTCQAAVRLCEIGLIQEAQILVRTALETLFHASALLVKPEVFSKLQSHNDNEDIKQARDMLAHVPPEQLSIENKEFLSSVVSRGGGGQFSVFESARISGMMDLYSVQYRGLSSLAGHATFRSLDRSFAPEGSKYALYMGPSTNQLLFTISIIANCLKICVRNLEGIRNRAQ